MDPAKTVSLDDFADKVVVINVWGQWCGPCRSEISQLQKVYDATKADGVAFLGIDVRDNNRDAARDFVIDRKVTFPSIYDPSMRTMIAFGGKYPTTVIPSTIVLDREHRVAAVFLRELLAEDLQPVVQRLAAEPVSADMTGFAEIAAAGPVAGGAGRVACSPGWCRSPRRAWCRWCPVTCRISPRSSASRTTGADAVGRRSTVARRRQAARFASRARRCCSSPGFTAVFVLGTVAVLGMTGTLITNQVLLQRIGGVVTILMGLVFVGFIPLLQRETRFAPRQLSDDRRAHRCSVRCSRSAGRRVWARR